MKRNLLQVVAAALLVALLAACSTPETGGMTVRLDPTGNLGYEVSGGTLTIESRAFVFRNAPGEPEAIINGVTPAYFAHNGLLVEQWIGDPQSLSIVVPAGFTCTEPDPVRGCDLLSPGARAGYGMESSLESGMNQLLPHTVAIEHSQTAFGSSTWWVEFTFTGENAYGPFEFTRTFTITRPN